MIHVEKTASGYAIIKGGEMMMLKPAQLEPLLASIIAISDNIPDRVKLLWRLTTQPRARLVLRHKAIDSQLIDVYQLEVFYPNAPDKRSYKGPEHALPLEAIRRGYEGYGADVEVTEVTHDVVSQKIAERDLERIKWEETTMRLYGMTLTQVGEYVLRNRGVLPPERKEARNGTMPTASTTKDETQCLHTQTI